MLLRFILKRCLYSFFVLFVISLVVFSLVHMLPGDPVEMMLGDFATPQLVKTLRTHYGLDKPLYEQYIHWMIGILRGEWGTSIRTGQPVLKLLVQALEPSLLVAVGAAFISFCWGTTLGTFSAWLHGTVVERLLTSVAVAALAVPPFFFGLMLIFAFAIKLPLLPPSGYVSLAKGHLSSTLSYLVLPMVSVGLRSAAAIARISRTAVLDTINKEFVRTGRAKGLAEVSILAKYVLRNSLVTIVTVSGLQLGELLGGVVILENIFAIPGVGSMLVSAVLLRDFPLVQGCILILGAWFVFVNLFIDLCYGFLNPRVRSE